MDTKRREEIERLLTFKGFWMAGDGPIRSAIHDLLAEVERLRTENRVLFDDAARNGAALARCDGDRCRLRAEVERLRGLVGKLMEDDTKLEWCMERPYTRTGEVIYEPCLECAGCLLWDEVND